MRDRFNQFLRLNSVFHGSAQMKSELVRTVQRNGYGHRDQTSVALGQFFAFPNITKSDLPLTGPAWAQNRRTAWRLLKRVEPVVQAGR